MVTNDLHQVRPDKLVTTFLLLFIITIYQASGQGSAYRYFYRVMFRDKGQSDPGTFTFAGLVSDRAAARRQKAGITSPDFRDIPVNKSYLEQIKSAGFTLHCTSRWMNTAVFKTTESGDTATLSSFPFVVDVKVVKDPIRKKGVADKFGSESLTEDGTPYDMPVSMLNGIGLHNSGYNAKGMVIAILDAGFLNADNVTSLLSLRNRNGIKNKYDFVRNNGNVFDHHNHGTAVLSVLAGEMTGQIGGTAPGADYLLLITEDDETEYPVEEDFWVAGAEYADSAGADIISSSLGYFTFDNPLMNYKYSDMDGNRTFVTRAADIAVSRGMLVVCSAGNERSNPWLHIIAPSDGDSVIAVGAVDGNRMIASFSSAGPSYDKRIKPDVVAQGVSVPVQTQTTVISRAGGTSFSCPVISGMCACVMQAVPEASCFDLIKTLPVVSDRFFSPDSLYGYGIPDMAKLIKVLQETLVVQPEKESVVSPNPFADNLRVTFREPPEMVTVEFFNSSGKLLLKKVYNNYVSRVLIIEVPEKTGQGIYFIRLSMPGRTIVHKVIKMNR